MNRIIVTAAAIAAVALAGCGSSSPKAQSFKAAANLVAVAGCDANIGPDDNLASDFPGAVDGAQCTYHGADVDAAVFANTADRDEYLRSGVLALNGGSLSAAEKAAKADPGDAGDVIGPNWVINCGPAVTKNIAANTHGIILP
jgi:hypothetical protein